MFLILILIRTVQQGVSTAKKNLDMSHNNMLSIKAHLNSHKDAW